MWENYAPDHSSIGGKRIAAQGNLPSQCKVYVAGFRCEIFVIEIDKINFAKIKETWFAELLSISNL